jgi:hypothetical protein
MIRPRFSIRTLLVVVTLWAAYFGCWRMTKRWGRDHRILEDVYFGRSTDLGTAYPREFDSSPAPFVLRRSATVLRRSTIVCYIHEYHLWFFGYTRLLVERQVPPPEE